MFNEPGGVGPDPNVGRPPHPNHHSILDQPSSFVGDVISYLRAANTPLAKRLAVEMEQQGVNTPRELAWFVESHNDSSVNGTLTSVYRDLYRACSVNELAEGLPALVSLLHKILMDGKNRRHDSKLSDVLHELLEARSENEEIASKVAEVLTDRERRLLSHVVSNAYIERDGYLQSIEMLCELYPDTRSLESFLCAVARIRSSAVDGQTSGMTMRCVSAIAAASFAEAFQYLALALCDSSRSEWNLSVDLVAQALRDSARKNSALLGSFLCSKQRALEVFALKVTIFAGAESDAEIYESDGTPLPKEKRAELAGCIHAAFLTDSAHLLEIPRELALAALASISPRTEDVELARQEMQKMLEDRVRPSAELCLSVVNGAERVSDVTALQPFLPLDVPIKRRLSLTVDRPFGIRPELSSPPLVQRDFEDLAFDISQASDFNDVLIICRDYAVSPESESHVPRPLHSLTLFESLSTAENFLNYYEQLCVKGPQSFAVKLFPEFLSALACVGDLARDFSDRDEEAAAHSGVGYALESMRYLSKMLATYPKYIPLATSRLNDSDKEFLAEMPSEDQAEADLTLVTYELRAAFQGAISRDPLQWQRDIVEWWSALDPLVAEAIDSDALARVSAISEMRSRGSAMKLLKLVPLGRKKIDRKLFSAFAHGLTFQRGVSESILQLVESECGFDRARGFFLAQLLPESLYHHHGKRVLEIAEESLSEPGALSLDAVCTLGSRSLNPYRALALLKSKAAIGVDEALHTVTATSAAVQILSRRRVR